MIGVVWHLFFLLLCWWPHFFIFFSSLAFFVFSWTTHALTLRCHCLGWCGILFVMFLFCYIVFFCFSCFLFLQNRITSQERDIVSGRDTMPCQDMRTCHERTGLFERGDPAFLSGRSVGVIPSHILVKGCRVLTRPTPSPVPPHFFSFIAGTILIQAIRITRYRAPYFLRAHLEAKIHQTFIYT